MRLDMTNRVLVTGNLSNFKFQKSNIYCHVFSTRSVIRYINLMAIYIITLYICQKTMNSESACGLLVNNNTSLPVTYI